MLDSNVVTIPITVASGSSGEVTPTNRSPGLRVRVARVREIPSCITFQFTRPQTGVYKKAATIKSHRTLTRTHMTLIVDAQSEPAVAK